MQKSQEILKTPVGLLLIEANEEAITAIDFLENEPESAISGNTITAMATQQLREYFVGERKEFELPLHPEGTDFQREVWGHLEDIPFGTTRSYLDIATRIGDQGAVRAVGAANGRNPIAIVLPCHRVIASNGALTGYAGGLHRKKWLLEHESGVLYGKQGTMFAEG